MRIGIHTVKIYFIYFFIKYINKKIKKGTIIGGILGTDLVRYDIFGKHVLIANKMESNG